MGEDNGLDMMKMMAEAMRLSKVLNGDGEDNKVDNETEDMDGMENMLQMIKMVSLISNTMKPNLEISNQTTEISKNFSGEEFIKHVSYFEEDVNTPAIKTIKSALPYLDYKYQRNIGVALKLIEIQRILDKYSSAVENMDITKNENWRKDMILAIRPHMEEEKRRMIDMLINLMEIKAILDRTQSQ